MTEIQNENIATEAVSLLETESALVSAPVVELDNFPAFVAHVKKTFARKYEQYKTRPQNIIGFAPDIFACYLKAYEDTTDGVAQQHKCRACADFLKRYGRLVFITPEGNVDPALWDYPDEAPAEYALVIERLREHVTVAAANGHPMPFHSTKEILGTPEAGGWSHLHLDNILPIYTDAAIPEWMQAVAMVNALFREAHLQANDGAVLRNVAKILTDGSIKNSDLHGAVARELYHIFMNMESIKNPIKAMVWLQAKISSYTPHFFAIGSSSVLNRMYEMAFAGADFGRMKAAFNSMLDPMTYQRPTEDPLEGNIEAAEQLIEKLGLEESLARRCVTSLEEILPHSIWKPTEEVVPEKKGIFSGLKAREQKTVEELASGIIQISWRMFSETVLPEAKSIKMMFGNSRMAFGTIMSAVNKDAKPIMRYDNGDNPYSWVIGITENGLGYTPANVGIEHASTHEVACITHMPVKWNSSTGLIGFNEQVLFFIKGCKYPAAQLGLFPQLLIPELYPVRSTIEKFSASQKAVDSGDGVLFVAAGQGMLGQALAVTTSLGESKYLISSWD